MRNESHGLHLKTIVSYSLGDQGVINLVPSVCQDGKFLVKRFLSCVTPDDTEPKPRTVFSMGLDNSPSATVIFADTGECAEVLTAFPTGQAMEDVPPIEATLEVDDWESNVEADIYAGIDDETGIDFFCSNYLEVKNCIEPGKRYKIDLCAFAYLCEVVEQSSFSLNDVPWLKAVYGDAAGERKPINFSTSKMVAYIPKGGEYPASAEFQTPVLAVEECDILGTPMYRMKVRVLSSDGMSQDVYATLYVKQEMFDTKPEVGTPIRGLLWMTGNILMAS